jgi:phosphoenolpyruvate synthase/pyruvate phosphate dikinase
MALTVCTTWVAGKFTADWGCTAVGTGVLAVVGKEQATSNKELEMITNGMISFRFI